MLAFGIPAAPPDGDRSQEVDASRQPAATATPLRWQGSKRAMAEYDMLRNAKQAVEEGLLGEAEYDQIKVAFTKAQQIKAGLEAGFIREEDYMQARDSFLQSLDFKVHGPQVVQPQVVMAPAPAPSNLSGGGMRPAAIAGMSRGISGANLHSPVTQVLAPAAAAAPAAPIAPPPAPVAPAAPRMFAAPAAPAVARSAESYAPPPSTSGEAPGTVPIPTDLHRIGRAGIADGKKSMSGISLHDSCINIYNHIKTRSAFKWVSYKIDDAGAEVVTDQLGSTESSYEQFLATLPHNQCRFAVYDYAYSNSDTGQTNQKLVFIHWAPLGSTTKSKMMYASTKEFLKGFLEGVGAELQADSLEELQEAELVARIAQGMARK